MEVPVDELRKLLISYQNCRTRARLAGQKVVKMRLATRQP